MTPTKETNHAGRLVREIIEGTLALKGTSLVRYRFAFTAGDEPIGLYLVDTPQPKKVRLARSWNVPKTTYDPFSGLTIPTHGRKLSSVVPGKLLFLAEFDQGGVLVDKVAFRTKHVRLSDGLFSGVPSHFLFEQAELDDVEIVG